MAALGAACGGGAGGCSWDWLRALLLGRSGLGAAGGSGLGAAGRLLRVLRRGPSVTATAAVLSVRTKRRALCWLQLIVRTALGVTRR